MRNGKFGLLNKRAALLALAGLAITVGSSAGQGVPAYNWTGFYIGGNAGFAWSNSDITWTTTTGGPSPAITIPATGPLKASGFTAGGQAGYNSQVNQFVYGVETDINFTDLRGSRASVPLPPFVNNELTTFESKWFSTLRGRLGVAVDRVLFYGTGGLAVASVKYSDHSSDGVPLMNSRDATRAGWTAGGGIEWAFNRDWTVKAEYLHVDLGNVTYNNLCSAAGLCTTGLVLDHKLREDIVRVGINYRFGGPVTGN